MTPCEKLGYKVGDRFEVVTQSGSEAQVGWVVVLYVDDGSNCPFFYKVGEEFGRTYCPGLTEIIPLNLQTEAEKRGAKFGTIGVIKATGQEWVFVRQVGSLWRGMSDSGVVIGGSPSDFRLDHEPEYKEIPFSEATDEQRLAVGNLAHSSGRKITQIVKFDNGTYGFTISGMCSVFMDTYNLTVRVPA